MGYSSMSHTSWWSAQNDNNEIHALITKEKMNDHVGVLGTGVPRLACLRPAAWLEWRPSVAHLHQHKAQDPREGPSLARRTTRRFLKHDLLRLAREEAERSRWGTLRGAHDASHDDRGCHAGARRAPAHAASPFPLWCKGGKRGQEDQAKAPISVQRDQDQSNGGKEVTMEPRTASPQGLWLAKTNFSQDKCTRYSPSKWPIVGTLPAQYLGRGPGPMPINRTSHPQNRGSQKRGI